MPNADQLSALERLTKLRETGALTEEEFTAQKAAILAGVTGSTANRVPFYRRLWVVVTLTCLLLTSWLSLIVLVTGDVYKRAKDGSLIPIKPRTRHIYAGFLTLWFIAAIINAIIHPDVLKEDIAGRASTQASSGAPQAAVPSSSQASNAPDACDSSDASDMVKSALENAPGAQAESLKVLDFGKAQETWFDKAANIRRCAGVAYLNSGQTVVAYQLFFGPSGREMVQAETGDQASMQIEVDKAKKEEAENAAKPAVSGSSQFTGGKYHRTDPASSDMTIARNGNLWHIAIDGAGPPNGGNTPADCSLEAEGPLVNGQIKANIVPFKNDTTEVSADDLKTSPGTVVVQLTASGVTVAQASVDGFCGLGSDLTGSYQPA